MQELRHWYVGTLVDRVTELEKAVATLVDGGDRGATIETIRGIAHALRGSGATYGYPQITAAAAALEEGTESELDERTRRLISSLRTTIVEHFRRSG